MPPNETTVLLTNYREKRSLTNGRNSYHSSSSGVNSSLDNCNHVVQVSKDPAEYEPIFSIDDYSSTLTLAELLPFQDDPWWRKFRLVLFLAFWLIFLVILATACTLSYQKYDPKICQAVDPNLPITPTLITQPLSVIMTTATSAMTSKLAIMP
ncbi:uncharacterized protein LOC142242924 [Haematobia irritans]|uniref:uncharacterized protein LOC142242924 n=1 Tax=Haematobia irritans TaxID=7368 RepID=UPI003F507F5D